MTDPLLGDLGPAEVTPGWLVPRHVSDWLRLTDAGDPDAALPPTEAALLTRCCLSAEPYVQDCRPDQWAPVPTDPAEVRLFRPDAEVYGAAVMLASRIFRRRNSPGGLERVGELVSYVARFDPEIERALRVGAWTRPRVG